MMSQKALIFIAVTLPTISLMKRLTFTLALVLSQVTQGQTTIYHEYIETASDFAISKWNCKQEELNSTYVIETVDKKGRVIELKFKKNDELNFSSLCYLSPWIKYEYPTDSTIVISYLWRDGKPQAFFECEIPSKVTHFLTKDLKTIKSTLVEFEFDPTPYLTQGWTKEDLEEIIRELNKDNGTASPFVDYYLKSKSKLNGNFPTSKDFDIEKFYVNDIEKKEIKTVGNTGYKK